VFTCIVTWWGRCAYSELHSDMVVSLNELIFDVVNQECIYGSTGHAMHSNFEVLTSLIVKWVT